MESYWWYVTLLDRHEDFERGASEELLQSAADISGSIGTEIQELPDGLRMRIYYRSDSDLSHWRNGLLDALGELAPESGIRIEDMGKIENQQWSRQSEDAFPPLAVGEALVVLAPWHKGKEPANRTPIYINPGSAFGTGYHESTQVVLELLEKEMRKTNGIRETIDVGTGSGILTIAALKFGVDRVLSRDLDPAVVSEVEGNFALNDIDEGKVTLEVGNLLSGVVGQFDLLTANILLGPLLEMLPSVRSVLRPGGIAIFSGMTENERDIFLSALKEVDLFPIAEATKEEWWGVVAKNPA